MLDAVIQKRALFGGRARIAGLAVLHFSLGDGSLWIFIAFQGLVFVDIPGDVAMGVVGVDGAGVKFGLAHENNAVKII